MKYWSTMLAAVIISSTVNAGEKKVIIGADLGNGNFNADTSDVDGRHFLETAHWFNLSGSEAGPNATKKDGAESANMMGDGSRNALLLKGPVFINDTSHTVAAAGEIFQIKFDFCDAIPKWIDGTDSVEVFFFTTSGAVDGYTEAEAITEIGKVAFTEVKKDGKFEPYINESAYTTTAGDIGKVVYVGFRAATSQGIGRLDNFVFEVVAK
ncbi:hypothetical protein ACFSSA_15760 [Luteolibacter algae]|uniref:Uncharacterized protein n=1 Tax=Luteolibacter algae TaxID=454151 RepID=A0ABW5DAV8_9BACT